MDLFVLHGIVTELQEEIAGGFITKIYQMNRTDLLLRVRRAAKETQVLISTHPDFYRLHLTEKKYPNPMVPPRFCTYLRKHITGARIDEVSQTPLERVIRFGLQKKMDAGFVRRMVLAAELVGKASNVLLLEGETILDCLHFRKGEEGNRRAALPGMAYAAPASAGRVPLDDVDPEMIRKIVSSRSGQLWKDLVEKISGLPPLLAREIEHLGGRSAEDVWKTFSDFRDRYARADFAPRIFTVLGGKKILSPFPLQSLKFAHEEIYPSMNAAADAYYFDTVMQRQLSDRKQAVVRRLKQLIARLEKRRENLEADRAKLEKDLELKEQGDILVANFPKMKKGMRRLEALDFRRDPPSPVVIPLDEALEPAANVERFFKRYKRAKRGLEFISTRSAETAEELAYLESFLFQVEEAADAREMEEIREELQAERILPPPRKPGRKEAQEHSVPVRRFRSSEGLEIFCGKSSAGNDYMLRRLARGNDLWFHAQGIPGSHVLLKVGPKEPDFQSILEAATVAAFYSRGRGSGRMPVDYTPAKNVRKAKGARPGLVFYSQQKTLYVEPAGATLEKLQP